MIATYREGNSMTQKVTIEIHYKPSAGFVRDLVNVLERAEFASVTGDTQMTYVNGELSLPDARRPAVKDQDGGVW